MVEWLTSSELTPYPDAVAFMESRVADIANGRAEELIWLVEHPPLYTAGTSAKLADLVDPNLFPVFQARRGGQYTYHGPGQRVAYAMLDVGKRGRDVRQFVRQLEEWIIATLAEFNVLGERRKDRIGVWVVRDSVGRAEITRREDKIAAIGIRLRKWVSFHGFSINVAPNLSHYNGIVPCGINSHGITSLVDLGLNVSMAEVDVALQKTFPEIF